MAKGRRKTFVTSRNNRRRKKTKGKKQVERVSLNNWLKTTYFNPKNPEAFGGARKILTKLRAKDREKAKKWFESQDAYTLHKKITRKFPRRKTVVGGAGHQLQMDLMDVHQHAGANEGVKFLLTAVDVLSRKAFVETCTNKTGKTVASAVKKILDGQAYVAVQTDKGKEFYNADVRSVFKTHNVNHFSTHDDATKASMVERFNRTLRNKIHRYLTHTRQETYIDVLDDLVEAYNETPNTATKLAPNAVTDGNAAEIARLNAYTRRVRERSETLRLGDYVRIVPRDSAFRRGYEAGWSEEVFRVVSKNDLGYPLLYTIKDLAGETLAGRFYGAELQRVTKPTEFKVQEVLKTRKNKKGEKEFFVRWLGYPESTNSWIRESQFVQ